MRVRIGGLVAALLLAAAAATACTYYPEPPSPTPAPPGTAVPIMPTGWPNGTTGTFGLRIDPSLLSNIPTVVGGNQLVEAADIEIAAMSDASYAKAFSSYYVAGLGSTADLNWLQVTLGAPRADAQSEDFYTTWRDGWFQTACSQAGGIDTTAQQEINLWQVDVAYCIGGVDAYTLTLDDGVIVSIMDLGPRRLGLQLIQGIN